jgi:hypothetical protein
MFPYRVSVAIGIPVRFTTIVAALAFNRLLLRDVQTTLVAGHEGFNFFGFGRPVFFGWGIEPSFDKIDCHPDDKNPNQ